MKYNPLVTIVIPVYNGSNYLKQAIESALKQTYKNVEILVVNDGSTDDGKTEKVAKSFGSKIRYISKKNGGVSSALNLAIKEMKGEWLSWLSHDDLYKPNKIEIQIEELNRFIGEKKEITNICLYGANERINADGKFISRKKLKVPNFTNPIDCLINNIEKYSICGCTVLMSKKTLDMVGGFDETIRTVSDAELWYRMMLSGFEFHFIDSIIVQSRQHNQQVGNRSMQLFEKEHAELMKKITNVLLTEISLAETQKYRLSKGLMWNGFFEISKLVKKNLVENKQYHFIRYNTMYIYVKIRRTCFVFLRTIYRKITLK